jgi:hypothetical protein
LRTSSLNISIVAAIVAVVLAPGLFAQTSSTGDDTAAAAFTLAADEATPKQTETAAQQAPDRSQQLDKALAGAPNTAADREPADAGAVSGVQQPDDPQAAAQTQPKTGKREKQQRHDTQGSRFHPGMPFSIGVGVRASTLGAGLDIAVPLGSRMNVRTGVNVFDFSHDLSRDGITYGGAVHLRSVQALLDFFPHGGAFHISPGALYMKKSQFSATASVPGGSLFSLNGVDYMSSASDPVIGGAGIETNQLAPMVMIGWGNLLPSSRHFSLSFEVGAAYIGSPKVALAMLGSVCDTTGANCRSIASDATVQQNIAGEITKLNKSASPFQAIPVISLGIGYRFGTSTR